MRASCRIQRITIKNKKKPPAPNEKPASESSPGTQTRNRRRYRLQKNRDFAYTRVIKATAIYGSMYTHTSNLQSRIFTGRSSPSTEPKDTAPIRALSPRKGGTNPPSQSNYAPKHLRTLFPPHRPFLISPDLSGARVLIDSTNKATMLSLSLARTCTRN